MFVHFRISAVCSCCLSDLFFDDVSFLLSICPLLGRKKVCWRKEKIKRMCFIITLFQLFVIIFAVDWYLLVGKIGAWYLIPFLLCLLLFVSHSFFSTLIDICAKKIKQIVLFIWSKGISGCSQKTSKGFCGIYAFCMDCSGVYSMIFYSLHYCIQGCHLSQYFA